MCPCTLDRIGIWQCGFCEKGKTGEPEETLSEQVENQQQILHTYDAESGIPGPHWWEARALTIAPPTDSVLQTKDQIAKIRLLP